MISNRFLRLALVAGLAVVPAACGGTDDAAPAADSTADMAPAPETSMTAANEPGTIVEVAAAAGTFETLLAAAAAAGLVETLESDGPFTVFAPTDEAFAALPEGTVEGLLADPEALAEILLFHVVSGEYMASDVTGMSGAATVQGDSISFMVHDGAVMVNNATVVTADVQASNGVIHVIDTVLLPGGN